MRALREADAAQRRRVQDRLPRHLGRSPRRSSSAWPTAPHRPALVVTRPDRPQGRGRAARRRRRSPSRPRARARARPARRRQRRRRARADRRGRSPRPSCVCAFGALIKEPLLSEHEMLNVHPSLLPRWRGAAPVERAIMAGDERDRRLDHAPDRRAGQRAGVPAASAEPIRPDDTYGTLAARLRGARRRAAGARARRAARRSPSRTRRGVTYAEKIGPRGPHARPRAAGRGARARRARAAPAHRRADRSFARRRRSLGVPRARRRCGDATARSSCSRCSRPAGARWPTRTTCAGTGRSPGVGLTLRRAQRASCAYRVVRRVFEQGAYADRALRGEAERRSTPRDRALAKRLAYGDGAAPGHAATWITGRLADRGRLDPPVRAALRLGLYQLLFLDGIADHAAVAESVELAKPQPGRTGWSTRCCAACSARASSCRADDTPDGRGDPPLPSGVARAAVVGLARAPRQTRALLARRQRARRARAARQHAGRGSDDFPGASPTAELPEALVARRPAGRASRRPSAAAGAIMAAVARLDARRARGRPAARRARARPVRRARRQDTHLAALMGDDGRDRRGRAPRGPRRGRCARPARGCRRRIVDVARRRRDGPAASTGAFDRVLVDPPCSGPRHAALAPRPALARDAGGVDAAGGRAGRDPRRRARAVCGPAGGSSTRSARSRRARRRARRPEPSQPTTCAAAPRTAPTASTLPLDG